LAATRRTHRGYRSPVAQQFRADIHRFAPDNNGVRSFYFHDPAGKLLEIGDGDLWLEQ
jgi:hypothetical protein